MTKYIVKRLLLMIPTLLGVAVLIFFLMRVVPGDIVELRFAGESAFAQKENLDKERARLGLDRPLAIDGACLTIRKFSAEPYRADDLVSFGTLTRQTVELLDACVRGRLNILVSGGTGAGKTTTLNVLSSFLPDDERILTIEDSAELRLQQPHVVRLEYRPPNIEGRGEITIRDLVKNALRMRPDRIVVGEVRGGEALDMMQAMNTGHDGSIST